MDGIDRSFIRELIRDAIRSELSANSVAEPVVIETDSDLQVLIGRIVDLMKDPVTGDRLSKGELRFRLQHSSGSTGSVESSAPLQVQPVSGVVNEKVLNEFAQGAEIQLAPGAVVTPLARDRARQRQIRLVWRR